ncbi:unnamed protein product [Prorocentrum cordatum]|uniref:Uncharacterized protein n=1 Tax=Prorocentrum cordatum TaxID=2364126 RepID=A0ABN9PZG9_9DINO|nr:unnamed protein product [Polarella glacialis]
MRRISPDMEMAGFHGPHTTQQVFEQPRAQPVPGRHAPPTVQQGIAQPQARQVRMQNQQQHVETARAQAIAWASKKQIAEAGWQRVRQWHRHRRLQHPAKDVQPQLPHNRSAPLPNGRGGPSQEPGSGARESGCDGGGAYGARGPAAPAAQQDRNRQAQMNHRNMSNHGVDEGVPGNYAAQRWGRRDGDSGHQHPLMPQQHQQHQQGTAMDRATGTTLRSKGRAAATSRATEETAACRASAPRRGAGSRSRGLPRAAAPRAEAAWG